MIRSDWKVGALCGAAMCVMGSLAGPASADLSTFSNFAPVNNNAAGAGSYNAGRTTLTLTTGVGSQASSAFANTPQNISSFNAYFTYTATSGADGAAFVLQNDPRGVTALGDSGGALGYGGTNASFPAISSSAAEQFNLFGTQGEKLNTNGATGTYNATSPLSLGGQTTGAYLSYNGTDLRVTLANGSLYTRTYAGANLQSFLGTSTALVGFTGATGGVSSTQSVSNFTFKSTPTPFLPVAVTGYNQDMIVEKTAPTTGTTAVSSSVTATLDNGTAKTGATYYEQGYNASNTNVGVPAAGSSFASASDFFHSFQMAPSYTANDAILIDSANTTGRFSIASPARYSALSLLTAGGNGAVTYSLTVHHTTGPDETITGVTSPDWFNNSPLALNVGSRVSDGATNPTIDAAGNNPRLYQVDVPLADTTDPVSSIDFTYTSGGGHAGLFALSGASAVPEPATAGLLALAGLGLLARRRRAVM